MPTQPELLSRTFVELADTMVADFDVVDLFALLTERCVELFGASAAGLLLADDMGTLRLVAATNEATELVELFQLQNDEGPCLDCFRSGQNVLVADLAGATRRWPMFVSVATGAGFQAVNAFPMRLRDRIIGALNLFDAEPARLEHADAVGAQALADIATIGLLQYRVASDTRVLADQLRVALQSRVAIEQAKGVIAEHGALNMGEAFWRLRQYSRSHGRPLVDVAEEIVRGSLSPDALGAPRAPTASA